ncbi:MAG TPA: CPBP family intramembrane glutamic endopeptidase [Candidatus Paceibacterota bacterium]
MKLDIEKIEDILYPRKFKFFSVSTQIVAVVLIFISYTILAYLDYEKTGTIFGLPFRAGILFVPIFEELIFRGCILVGLTRYYSVKKSIVISSLLFGLWHFKNIFVMPIDDVVSQMLYAGLIFGPIVAYLTLRLKSIWPGVILHYLNNILAPLLPMIWLLLQK